MTPWGPLLAGCLVGIGVAVTLRVFAGPIETPADLGVGVRASFIPVIAGVAFVVPDPFRQLTGALPTPVWLTGALRMAIVLPVLVVSCIIQLLLASAALTADLHAAGQPPAALPWIAFAAQLASWCALALALAAGLDRTRWRDLAGIVAAVAAMAAIGVIALFPLHLMPAAITGLTSAQRRQWTTAWHLWSAAGVIAAMAAAWAAGDTWRRLPTLVARPASHVGR